MSSAFRCHPGKAEFKHGYCRRCFVYLQYRCMRGEMPKAMMDWFISIGGMNEAVPTRVRSLTTKILSRQQMGVTPDKRQPARVETLDERRERCRRASLVAARVMTREQKIERARKASAARWEKYRRKMTPQERGHIGGINRAKNLSPERRAEIARMGGFAAARSNHEKHEASASDQEVHPQRA